MTSSVQTSTAPALCAYCSSPVLEDRLDEFCSPLCAAIHQRTGRQLIAVSDAAFDRLDAFATTIREQPAAVLERFINRALDVAERRTQVTR